MKFNPSMITPEDEMEALKKARGRVCLTPFREIADPPLDGNYTVSETSHGWSYVFRRCSRKSGTWGMGYGSAGNVVEELTGGAILTITSPLGISLSARLKPGWNEKSKNRAKYRLFSALRRLESVHNIRVNAMNACEEYMSSGDKRKRQAELSRLARKIVGLPGYESLIYANWTRGQAEIITKFCQL